MAIYTVRGSDGNLYDVKAPDGTPTDEIVNYMQSYLTPKPQAGFWDMFKESAKTLGDLPEAAVFGATDSEKARKELIAAQQIPYQTTGLEDIESAGQAWDWIKQTAGSSAGYLVAPALASKTASMLVKGPGAVKALGYGTYALQYLVDNLSRQAVTQDEAVQQGLKPPPVDVASALVAAGAQTWLDYEGMKFFMPLFSKFPIVKSLMAGEKTGPLTREAEDKLVEAFNSNSITYKNGIAKGIAGGVAFEIPQEIAQQALERWQAGLSLSDDDARREYLEAGAGAVLLGGGLGGVSGALNTPVEKQRAADIIAARKAEEESKKTKAATTQQQQAFQQEMPPRIGYTEPEPMLGLPTPENATSVEEPGVTPQPRGTRPTKRPSGVMGSIIPAYGEVGDEELDVARMALMKSRSVRNNPNGMPYSIGHALRQAGLDASKDRINVVIHTLREEGFIRNQRTGAVDIGPIEPQRSQVTPDTFNTALRSYGVEPTQAEAPAAEEAPQETDEQPFTFSYPPPSADVNPIPQQSVDFPLPPRYYQQQEQQQAQPEEQNQQSQNNTDQWDYMPDDDAAFEAGLRGEGEIDPMNPWSTTGQQVRDSLKEQFDATEEPTAAPSQSGWERMRAKLAAEGLLNDEAPTEPFEGAEINPTGPTEIIQPQQEPVQVTPQQKIGNTNGFRAKASLLRAAADPRIAEIEGEGMEDGRVFLHAAPGFMFSDNNTQSMSVGNATDVKSALSNLVPRDSGGNVGQASVNPAVQEGTRKRTKGAVQERAATPTAAEKTVAPANAAAGERTQRTAPRKKASSGSLETLRKKTSQESMSLLLSSHMSLADHGKLQAELAKARPSRSVISNIMEKARAAEAVADAETYERGASEQATTETTPKTKKTKKGSRLKVSTGDEAYARGMRSEASQERDYNDVTAAVRAAYNGRGEYLLKIGRIKVVKSPENLPARPNGEPHFEDAKGYYDGTTTYIVSDNVAPSEVPGLILHEIGVHYGMPRLLGRDAFNRLKADYRARVKSGDRAFVEADKKIPDETPADMRDEEGIAYLVQNAPSVPFVKRLLSAIKLALYRLLGGRFISLNENDLRTLAIAALQRVTAAEAAGNPESFYATRWAAPAFYSALERMIDKAKFEKAPVDQWKSYINSKKGEFKVTESEIKNSTINEYLDSVIANDAQNGTRTLPTKAMILDAINANGMVILEYRLTSNTRPIDRIKSDQLPRWKSFVFHQGRGDDYIELVASAVLPNFERVGAERTRLGQIKTALNTSINGFSSDIEDTTRAFTQSTINITVRPYLPARPEAVLSRFSDPVKHMFAFSWYIPDDIKTKVVDAFKELQQAYPDPDEFRQALNNVLESAEYNPTKSKKLSYYLYMLNKGSDSLLSYFNRETFRETLDSDYDGPIELRNYQTVWENRKKFGYKMAKHALERVDTSKPSEKKDLMELLANIALARTYSNSYGNDELLSMILYASGVDFNAIPKATMSQSNQYLPFINSLEYIGEAINSKLAHERMNGTENKAKLALAKGIVNFYGANRQTEFDGSSGALLPRGIFYSLNHHNKDALITKSPEVIQELKDAGTVPFLNKFTNTSQILNWYYDTDYWRDRPYGQTPGQYHYYPWDLTPQQLLKEIKFRSIELDPTGNTANRADDYKRLINKMLDTDENSEYAYVNSISTAKTEALNDLVGSFPYELRNINDNNSNSNAFVTKLNELEQVFKDNADILFTDKTQQDAVLQTQFPEFRQKVMQMRDGTEQASAQLSLVESALTNMQNVAVWDEPGEKIFGKEGKSYKSPFTVLNSPHADQHFGDKGSRKPAIPNPMFHVRAYTVLTAPVVDESLTKLPEAFLNATTADGTEDPANGIIPTFYVDEIQSDWEQERGKEGTWGSEEAVRAKLGMSEVEWKNNLTPEQREEIMRKTYDPTHPDYDEWTSKQYGVKPPPFKETKDTVRMAVRRAISYAVQNNFERMVISPGVIHAIRWGSDGYVYKIETTDHGSKVVTVKGSSAIFGGPSTENVVREANLIYADAEGLTSAEWDALSPTAQQKIIDKYENVKHTDPKTINDVNTVQDKVAEYYFSRSLYVGGQEQRFVIEPSEEYIRRHSHISIADWAALDLSTKDAMINNFAGRQKLQLRQFITNITYEGTAFLKAERAINSFFKSLADTTAKGRTYNYRFSRKAGLEAVYDVMTRSELNAIAKQLGVPVENFYIPEQNRTDKVKRMAFGINITPEVREKVLREGFPRYSRGPRQEAYSRGPKQTPKVAPPHSDRTLEEIFRQRANTFEERFRKEGGIIGAIKYAFTYEGAERWIERLQSERRPLNRLQTMLADAGELIIGEKGFNNLYTLITLSSGIANHLKTKYLHKPITALDNAMNAYAKANNLDIKTAMQRVDAYFLARHEPERRWVKYLLNVPLNNEDQFLVPETGKTMTAAMHRDHMLRELYSDKNLATDKAKTAQMYKKILERFVAEKRYDTKGVTTLRNVKPGTMSVDPDDAIYNVLGEFTQVELATLRDGLKAEMNGKNRKLLEDISNAVVEVQKNTKTLNKMANYWSQPVDNIAAFYDWNYYVPYKGKPESRVSEGDERLEYTSRKLMASDYTEFTPGFGGRDSPTDNSIFQVMADAAKSALRAGRKDVPEAIQNLGDQGHIKLKPVRTIDFLERYTTDIDPDELKGKSNSRIFRYLPNGKIEIFEIQDEAIREAVRRSWQDPSPFVQFANMLTSAIGQSHTRYNPPFHPANFVRDVLTNAFTMGAELGPVQTAALIKEVSRMVGDNGIGKAMQIARLYQNGNTDEIERLAALPGNSFYKDVYEYLERGGQVTYVSGLATKGKVDSLVNNIQRGRFVRAKEAVDEWVDVWADGFEFTSRAAGFAVMRNMLREREQKKFASANRRSMNAAEQAAMENRIGIEAASYVKNLANFEEVGRWGRGAGALFMFFRPAATGAVRALDALSSLWTSEKDLIARMPKKLRENQQAVANTLAKHRKREKDAKKMLVSVAGAGGMLFTMAMLAAGRDDDDRNRILTDDMALWTRNLRLPLSVLGVDSLKDKYLQLPWGFGVGAFGAFGAQLMGTAYGAQSLKEMALHSFSIALDSYMPLPVSRINPSENFTAWLVDSMTPSLGRPFVEYAMNLDSIDREIYNNRVTKYGDAFLAGSNTPDLFIDGARMLTKITNTKINWQPEEMNFWTNSYMDALNHIASTTYGLGLWAAGEKTFDPKTDLFLLNSFFGNMANYDGRKFGKAEAEIKEMSEKLKMVKRDPYMYENYVNAHPYDEMLVYIYNKGANNQLRDLREMRNQILSSDMTSADRKAALDYNRLESNMVKRNLLDTFKYYGYEL